MFRLAAIGRHSLTRAEHRALMLDESLHVNQKPSPSSPLECFDDTSHVGKVVPTYSAHRQLITPLHFSLNCRSPPYIACPLVAFLFLL